MPGLNIVNGGESLRQEIRPADSTMASRRQSDHETTKRSPYPTPPPPTDPFPTFEADYDCAVESLAPSESGQTSHNGSNANSPFLRATPSAVIDEATLAEPIELPITPNRAKSASIRSDELVPKKTRAPSGGSSGGNKRKESGENARKLSASQMQALTSSPESLPIAVIPPKNENTQPMSQPLFQNGAEHPLSAGFAEAAFRPSIEEHLHSLGAARRREGPDYSNGSAAGVAAKTPLSAGGRRSASFTRPSTVRTTSTPPVSRAPAVGTSSVPAPNAARRNSFNPLARPPPLNLSRSSNFQSVAGTPQQQHQHQQQQQPQKEQQQSQQMHPQVPHTPIRDRVEVPQAPPTPVFSALPLPPMSLPTHLQLELANQKPSPLYIYQPQASDVPFESSAIKFKRLSNALALPWYLEQLLTFGTLACLDAWLYTFTILPIRFCIAAGVLIKWWVSVAWREGRWLTGFVWEGTWRLWRRTRRGRTAARAFGDGSQAGSESERSQSRPRTNGSAAGPHQDSQFGHGDSAGTTPAATPAATPTTRLRGTSDAATMPPVLEKPRVNGNGTLPPPKRTIPKSGVFRHRRTRSTPSSLTQSHKADLLQGAIILCSSLALMNLDASRMYHFIRAQSSMKLYVIYNILEVGDRLLSAVGQDIFECLFSAETLSRNSSGRSKILLPFGMFLLSLIYNVTHVFCLFYQVITLNVAVNSYSDSLLTLLISNQFTEIKGAVFKKIEKENLFQLTCADVVERFQLWVILSIIGLRNIVEVGGLSVPGAFGESDGSGTGSAPLHTSSILPASFTVLPPWVSWFLSGEVLSPFVFVILVEMMVDYIKHAYINKFNNVKPTIYSRMLDILCKDYYTNAFTAPSLTRRIGLPVIPLSCLFIRAATQLYHMFLATRLPPPIPTSTFDLSTESSTPSSPAMIAALQQLDTLIRNALGRAVYGYPYASPQERPFWSFSSDDAIALLTMLVFFFLTWVVLLIVKLLLGMVLLSYSRKRYAAMRAEEERTAAAASASASNKGGSGPGGEQQQQQQRENHMTPGKRIGSWGAIEVGDDRRRWIYADDHEGLQRMRERERKTEEKLKDRSEDGLAKVVRYEMGASKRIW